MILDAGCLDVIVMFDVLEHLLDPVRVLASVWQALGPGGLAVISTPNLNALSKFFLGLDWAVLSPAERLYYFTEATLTRTLRKAGFQKIETIRHRPLAGVRETMNAFYTRASQCENNALRPSRLPPGSVSVPPRSGARKGRCALVSGESARIDLN